ncbi:hypothetical protein M0811_00093 [Anaeramoeba ignava]|uniref:Uncharacterized protein n=1 Tax=Anaeramoeba ignava TaxID=1746090 RepID=A0A9Q0LNF2_ANAIG|nr:hypothetical protein M0811_00093 [Anaeramoeba ignava]
MQEEIKREYPEIVNITNTVERDVSFNEDNQVHKTPEPNPTNSESNLQQINENKSNSNNQESLQTIPIVSLSTLEYQPNLSPKRSLDSNTTYFYPVYQNKNENQKHVIRITNSTPDFLKNTKLSKSSPIILRSTKEQINN